MEHVTYLVVFFGTSYEVVKYQKNILLALKMFYMYIFKIHFWATYFTFI
jgi:hypothetical protein